MWEPGESWLPTAFPKFPDSALASKGGRPRKLVTSGSSPMEGFKLHLLTDGNQKSGINSPVEGKVVYPIIYKGWGW